MALRFNLHGRQVIVLREGERAAAAQAVTALLDWRTQTGTEYGLPHAACSDFFAQLLEILDTSPTVQYLVNLAARYGEPPAGQVNRDPESLPCDVPFLGGIEWEEGDPLPPPSGEYAQWGDDPELFAIYRAAMGGLIVDQAGWAALERIVSGVASIENGRCAWRVKWGLVGTVAVMGALLFVGGSYIYRGIKRRR